MGLYKESESLSRLTEREAKEKYTQKEHTSRKRHKCVEKRSQEQRTEVDQGLRQHKITQHPLQLLAIREAYLEHL